MLGPALGAQQSYAMLQAWERVVGKLVGGRGPGCVGQQSTDYEPAVFSGGQEDQQAWLIKKTMWPTEQGKRLSLCTWFW